MTDVNAAIVIHQLERIENINKIRAEYAELYFKEFEDFDLIELPPNKSERKNVWHLFPILLKLEKLKITRDQFINALDKEGIGTGIHYKAIHEQQYYKNKYGYKKNSFERAEYVSERTVSIPLQSSMDKNDVYDVVKAVKKLLNYYNSFKGN
jgi:dTDP-4-amino-4,6-dideoxygalactose transaminase